MSAADTVTITLTGPTASGKTAAALALAAALTPHGGAEIISMDSALVYRGMDIGTAKPTAAERAQVPHHLIDILDPLESYSAAAFVADARRLIGDIRERGRIPLIVGGTLLYHQALVGGLDDMPPTDPQVRQAIRARAAAQGWPALHAQLHDVDPQTAERLAPNDGQRIGRALEVWTMTGRPLSSFHRHAAAASARQDMPVISLEPRARAWLHARIAARFESMLEAGFVQEVQALRQRGDLQPDLPSMRCVGYRQTWRALEEGLGLVAIRERGIAATRQLAKRQITWLRSMPERTVIAADAPDMVDQVVQAGRLALGLADSQ